MGATSNAFITNPGDTTLGPGFRGSRAEGTAQCVSLSAQVPVCNLNIVHD
jgi:hypothetical protein